MEVAVAVITSLFKTHPPRNLVGVIRHIKSTLNAIQDKTISPRALLRRVEPLLPESFKSSIMKLLQDEELFEHIWDEIETLNADKHRCFCF
jgi:hypothetical protein